MRLNELFVTGYRYPKQGFLRRIIPCGFFPPLRLEAHEVKIFLNRGIRTVTGSDKIPRNDHTSFGKPCVITHLKFKSC